MKTLKAPDYSLEECEKILEYVVALRKPLIQEFLRRASLPKSGTKTSLRDRIQEALNSGSLQYAAIVDFLDEVTPWGKQHVFLFRGPTSSIATWKDSVWISDRLREGKALKYLNARLPLVLPPSLNLSAIEHSVTRLRVTAVQGHVWWERDESRDRKEETSGGERVDLKAYVRRVDRGLTAFEWDLRANTAMVQVTQLPGSSKYEDAYTRFKQLVEKWLPLETFSFLNIRGAIKRLQEEEEQGKLVTRSHGIEYVTQFGRRLGARSASSRDSVLGEPAIDSAMKKIREEGVGRLGNFYWLPNSDGSGGTNPLSEEVHVILVGEKARINFPTPNEEPVVRYVLSRVRALSQASS
jgi:hypothetical protein